MRRMLLAILFSLLLPWAGEAATYWAVATGGATSGSCTETTPCTRDFGITKLTPGDFLNLKAGTYTTPIQATQVPSGTSWTAPVTIRAAPGLAVSSVILRPTTGSSGYGDAITVGGSSRYIIFDGFTVDATNVAYNAVRWTQSANHIRLIRMVLHSASDSNGVFCQDATTVDNELIDSEVHTNGNPGDTSFHFHGVYIRCQRTLVERNRIYNNSSNGVHNYWSMGTAHDNIYRYNEIYDNEAVPVTLGSGDRVQFYGNLVYRNAAGTGGVTIRTYGPDPDANKIYNNTIYDNASTCLFVNPGSTNTVIKNNLCFANGSDSINDGGTGSVKSQNLFANPGMVNPAAFDFSLTATATTAIDKGTASIATGVSAAGADDPNVPNGAGSGVDIGAFQTFRAVSAMVAGSTVTVNFDNLYQPMFGGSVNDLTLTVNGVAQAKSNLVRGNSTISFTIGTTPSPTATVQLTHTPAATDPIRDGICIGGRPTCPRGQRWNAQTLAVQVQGGQPVNPVLTVGPGQVERWNTTGVSSPPPPATGNTVVVDATTVVQGTGSSINIPHTTAATADLAAIDVVLGSNTISVSSATAGGLAASLGDRAAHATAALSAEWWARTSPPTGSNIPYVITLSGSTTYKATVTTYREVNVPAPYDVGAKVTTGTGNVSTNVSSAPGDLVCDTVGQLTPLGGAGSCEAAAATTTMSWVSSDAAAPRVHLTRNINADPGTPQPDPPTVAVVDAQSAPQLGVSAQAQFTHTAGPAAKLSTIDVCQDGTATLVNPTYGGEAMTQVARQAHGTQALACDVWQLLNPPVGAQQVIVPFSAATEWIIVARTYNGVRVVSPITGALTATGDDLAPSLTVTSKAADLVVSVVGAAQPGTTIAPGAGETERYDEPNATFFRSAGYTQPGATPSVVMAPPLGVVGGYVMIAYNINQFEEQVPVEDAVMTQHHYRWCEPDQAEGVRCVPHDAPTKLPMGGRARLRAALGITVANAPAQAWPLYWEQNASGTWWPLDGDMTRPVWACHDDHPDIAFGTPTTNQLPLDGRTFAGGVFAVNAPGQYPPLAANVGQQLEFETAICFHPALTKVDELRFRHFNAQGVAPHVSSVPAVARIRYPAISVR